MALSSSSTTVRALMGHRLSGIAASKPHYAKPSKPVKLRNFRKNFGIKHYGRRG